MHETQKFWMVWNPQSLAPITKHYNLGEAEGEATRLAQINPGEQFFILACIGGKISEQPVLDLTFDDTFRSFVRGRRSKRLY